MFLDGVGAGCLRGWLIRCLPNHIAPLGHLQPVSQLSSRQQDGRNSCKDYSFRTKGLRQKRNDPFLGSFFEELQTFHQKPFSSQRFLWISHWPAFGHMPFPKPLTGKEGWIWVIDWDKTTFSPCSWCLGKLYLKPMISQSSVSVWTKHRALLAEKNNAIWFPPSL